MGIIGGKLGYFILCRIARNIASSNQRGKSCDRKDELEALFGNQVFQEISGKTVIDFGCGEGQQAVEMALKGARKVVGIDIRESILEKARELALRYKVSDRCTFVKNTNERVDIILSKDAFEHFTDPDAILREMRNLLKNDGYVIAAFGPTWYHPRGGHLFSVFPWGHLMFSEKALIRWRSDFKPDGATRFNEVAGGLNKLTIRHFKHIVAESDFQFSYFEAVPIKGLRILNKWVLCEFTTSVVRCKLIPRN
jgi:SAM-dependent methyltransferase